MSNSTFEKTLPWTGNGLSSCSRWAGYLLLHSIPLQCFSRPATDMVSQICFTYGSFTKWICFLYQERCFPTLARSGKICLSDSCTSGATNCPNSSILNWKITPTLPYWIENEIVQVTNYPKFLREIELYGRSNITQMEERIIEFPDNLQDFFDKNPEVWSLQKTRFSFGKSLAACSCFHVIWK